MRLGIVTGWLSCGFLGVLLLFQPGVAFSQEVPRIKATIVSLDGQNLTVLPVGDAKPIMVGMRPATRIIKQEKKALADVHQGDFIGATVIKGRAGSLHAQEVHIFPDALRGSGEGFYPIAAGASRFILNATVAGVTGDGLQVKFHGASGVGAQCAGRAPLQTGVSSAGGCEGMATIAVATGVPVLALEQGDKSLLVPGAVVALSVMAGPDGRPMTPGLTVETVQTPSALPDTAPGAPAYRTDSKAPAKRP